MQCCELRYASFFDDIKSFMKIICINKYFQHTGGGDRFFFDSMRVLEKNGHQVIPFCLNYKGNLKTEYSKYFIGGVSGRDVKFTTKYRKYRLFINGIYSLNARKALRKAVLETRPDIAHLHILHYTISPSIIDELSSLGIPIIFSLHDYRIVCAGGFLYTQGKICMKCNEGKFYNAVRYKCYRNDYISSVMGAIGNYLYSILGTYKKVAAFTVPHKDMLELMVSFGIPRDKLYILENPFTSVKHSVPSVLGDYILYFGTLTQQKGVYTLLKTAKSMRDNKFVLCGNGDALNFVTEYIREHKLTNVILDTVTRSGSGLEELIASAYCVVSPSEWLTPLEYSTLEAMYQGKAVVASQIGGNKYIIKDKINGVLFEPGNSEDLEKGIQFLLSDRILCEAIGNSASRTITEHFTDEAFYHALIRIFDNTTKNIDCKL